MLLEQSQEWVKGLVLVIEKKQASVSNKLSSKSPVFLFPTVFFKKVQGKKVSSILSPNMLAKEALVTSKRRFFPEALKRSVRRRHSAHKMGPAITAASRLDLVNLPAKQDILPLQPASVRALWQQLWHHRKYPVSLSPRMSKPEGVGRLSGGDRREIYVQDKGVFMGSQLWEQETGT